MLQVIVLVLLILLEGCISIPLPAVEPEPYTDEMLQKIGAGKTSREQVREILGRPNATRENGDIWIYAKSRHLAFVITIPILAPVGGTEFIDDLQFIVAEFDEDIVRNIELIETGTGCSTTRICLQAGWQTTSGTNSYFFTEDTALVTSKRKDDQIAKEFNAVPGKCSLYIYAKRDWRNPSRTAINSISNVLISSDAYLYLQLEPDPQILWMTFRGKDKGEIIDKRIACEDGGVVFVRLNIDPQFWSVNYTIETVDADEGRKAVSTRDLILLP